jgi:hypothetical protein
VAITFVGEADAGAASVALPAFSADDIAYVFAFRDGSTTAPSLPAGWTNIASGGANTCSYRVGCRQLVGTDTTTGTWTNATEIEVVVLRGVDLGNLFGVSAQGSGSSTSMNWPTLATFEDPNAGNRSWVVLLGGHRSATDVNTVALSGATQRGGATTTLAAHTAESVSSWSSTSKTVNANSGWMTLGVEVPAAGDHDRVSQVPVEAGVKPDTAKGRVSQIPTEVAAKPDTMKARVSQIPVEVALARFNTGRISQLPVEVAVQRQHRSRNWGTIIG